MLDSELLWLSILLFQSQEPFFHSHHFYNVSGGKATVKQTNSKLFENPNQFFSIPEVNTDIAKSDICRDVHVFNPQTIGEYRSRPVWISCFKMSCYCVVLCSNFVTVLQRKKERKWDDIGM